MSWFQAVWSGDRGSAGREVLRGREHAALAAQRRIRAQRRGRGGGEQERGDQGDGERERRDRPGQALRQTNQGAAVRLGIFVVPDATDPQLTLEQIEAADRVGLDLVGVQDHPYQRRFFDTWTLLAYLAARTERVRLVPDVINLPLRQPAVLAKSVASLDLLSGGRVELGIGAGSFWEAVEAMGGPRRTPGESVEALEEAIAIIRGFWSGERSVNVEGRHYRVKGAKPGPPPAHPVGLWIGAYGPRMLRLTGRLGDGWLPSLGDHYLHRRRALAAQAAIDEAAKRPGATRRRSSGW